MMDMYARGKINEFDSRIETIEGLAPHKYGIFWDVVNATCTRLWDAAGITTTTTNFGHFGAKNTAYKNPFDSVYPWSERKLVNVDIALYRQIYAAGGKLTDCIIAWEGDVDFKLDGTNGFVAVYTPEFWGYSAESINGKIFGVADAAIDGWKYFEETIGARWFGSVDGTGITSKPGVIPVINETMQAIHARAKTLDMTLDDIYTWCADTLLMCVEYATLNTQTAVGNGADSVYVQSIQPFVAEAGVTRVVMTDAQAANFRAGVVIDIGTTDGANNTARRIVTSVEDYTLNSAYAVVNFDGAPVDIATSLYVSAHGVANAIDADILSTSGYIGTNSKVNAYYRGRVAHANYWRYVLGAYRQTGTGNIWIAKSRAEAEAYDALNTGVHQDTGCALPATSNYISELHMVAGLMLAPFAKTVTGDSSKPVGDYCYVPSLGTANTVLLAGGNAGDGVGCGRFYGYWHYSAAYSAWYVSGLPFLKTP